MYVSFQLQTLCGNHAVHIEIIIADEGVKSFELRGEVIKMLGVSKDFLISSFSNPEHNSN